MALNAGVCTEARPSRRAVTRAAAWTVPVIAVAAAAPAYAASPCDAKDVTMDWGNTAQYKTPTIDSGTYTIPDPDGAGPGQGLTLTVETTFLGSNTKLGNQSGNVNDNLLVTTNVGGSSASSLILHQSPKVNADKTTGPSGNANKSVTTFTFSRPVTNLSFTLRDIDSTYNDFWDGLAIAGAAFTATKNNPDMVGDGSVGSPLKLKNNDIGVVDSSALGNATISMASVQTFQLHYWNLTSTASSTIDGDQRVFLSNFSMSYKPC